jgi:subtilisin family serine protease
VYRKLALLAAASAALTACSDPITSSGSARLAPIAEISSSVQTELVPNEYIVALRSAIVSQGQLSASALSMAAGAGAQITYVYGDAINGFAVKADASALAAIRANPSVEYVEPVQVMRAIATQAPTPSWGLDRIDQANLPLNNSFTYPTGGGAVNVYIIDTGLLTTHNDFAGRVGLSSNHIQPTGGSPAWTDCAGHGTHVSGTIAGTTYGILKTATVHAVRVLDCGGSGTSASVIAGINWVIANAVQPAVSNMSLGGSADVSLDNATNAMANAGIVSAVAAGNSSGANACNFSPARAVQAVTVGSTTQTDARSSFSNIGTCLDIFAPGSAITSDYIGSNIATAILSGTSMASPHVAGVAALYRAQNPSATAAQTVAALINNATLNKVTNAGTGSPNRLLYMGFLNGAPPPPNQNPVARFTYSCSPEGANFACRLDGSSSSDPDGTVAGWSWTWPGKPNKSGVSVVYIAAAGTYNVSLTVTDNSGGTNTTTQQVVVGSPPPPPTNQPPIADFSYSCAPSGSAMQCTFDASASFDPDGSIVSYNWTAPGRPAKTGVIITRDYLHGATTTATLTVTDNNGATASKTLPVVVP